MSESLEDGSRGIDKVSDDTEHKVYKYLISDRLIPKIYLIDPRPDKFSDFEGNI